MSVDFNRATGLLILEVVNSNPNGDPDRENDPRQRPNGLGEISPVSVKRKIRDLIEDHDGVFSRACPKRTSVRRISIASWNPVGATGQQLQKK